MSDPTRFKPANELEFILAEARAGHITQRKVGRALMTAQLYVLVDRPMTPGIWDMEATPLSGAGPDGVPLLPVFTNEAHARAWGADYPSHPHGQWVDFKWLIDGMGPGTGLLINPGYPAGLTLPPQRLERLRKGLLET